MTQTKQFDTFDNLADRRELVILFERLGSDLPAQQAREVRAKFLEELATLHAGPLNGDGKPWYVNPDACDPGGAYMLFVNITGILGVPIKGAAARLDETVRKKSWLQKSDRRDYGALPK